MEERDPLDQLKSSLNRWQNRTPGVKRSELPPTSATTPTGWLTPESRLLSPRTPMSLLHKTLIVAALFFVAMSGLAAWVLWHGENLIKSGNVAVEITGPKTVKAGEEATFQFALTNQNNTPIQLVGLTVEYPPGTRSSADPAVELTREKFDLGTIKAGDTRKQSVSALIFGGANSSVQLSFAVEYRLNDSNAIFSKTTSYPVTVTDAPMTVTVTVPDAITVGQSFVTELEVSADARAPLAKPVIVVHYPAGFQFASADPTPTSGTNVWQLPSLKPGAVTKLAITGAITGQDNEEKAFRVEVGTGYTPAQDSLGVLYDSDLAALTLRRSDVDLALSLNGDTSSSSVGEARDPVKATLSWTNNLPDDVEDVQITAAFESPVLDQSSVVVKDGFYQSSANSILWNKSSKGDLATITAGDTGSVSFSFTGSSLLATDNQAVRNPEIGVTATLKGMRVIAGAEGKRQPVEAHVVATVKYNSVVQLTAKALHHGGSLPTTGPLPPKVGQRTTYNIVWSLLNSSSDLTEARVQATLPPSVEWVGTQTPTAEPLEFVASPGGGGEVIWNLGRVSAGTGTALPAREVTFQVALKPEKSQAGDVPRLLSAPAFSATDSFTKSSIKGELRQALTTMLSNDPGFTLGEDKVVE